MAPETGKRHRPNKVSPQHTLERVRNNQRQHRARRAEYIATMERKLVAAEARITDLESQLRMAQAGLAQQSHHRPAPSTQTGNPVLVPSPINDVTVTLTKWSPDLFFDPFGSLAALEMENYQTMTAVSAPAQENDATTTSELGITPLPQTAVPGWGLDIETAVMESMTYHSFGPSITPSSIGNDNLSSNGTLGWTATHRACPEGETTLLCSEAYILVAQYNSKGLSPVDVATWLWQGFRDSSDPGGGCRVEAASLFRLLAYISTDQGTHPTYPTT